MNVPTSVPYNSVGGFTPRGLIVTGLTAQLGAAFVFWRTALGIILLVLRLYLVMGSICLLAAGFMFVCLTWLAWRCNSWFAAMSYLVGCIVTLPWTVIIVLFFPGPS